MSDKTRKFAASIYLKNQKAVYNFNNISVISDNPVELSKKYGLYRQNFCGCDFARYAAK